MIFWVFGWWKGPQIGPKYLGISTLNRSDLYPQVKGSKNGFWVFGWWKGPQIGSNPPCTSFQVTKFELKYCKIFTKLFKIESHFIGGYFFGVQVSTLTIEPYYCNPKWKCINSILSHFIWGKENKYWMEWSEWLPFSWKITCMPVHTKLKNVWLIFLWSLFRGVYPFKNCQFTHNLGFYWPDEKSNV